MSAGPAYFFLHVLWTTPWICSQAGDLYCVIKPCKCEKQDIQWAQRVTWKLMISFSLLFIIADICLYRYRQTNKVNIKWKLMSCKVQFNIGSFISQTKTINFHVFSKKVHGNFNITTVSLPIYNSTYLTKLSVHWTWKWYAFYYWPFISASLS